ncbi:MAG: M3 family metallopeptidase [Roseateles asaccharophilus]|uniref:oligopeptidase A n=1 Tax=Roseateles asaccharophilus TaxID=582607 RepID=A0A4R6NBY6_9BURK|nr:M3 family metallopeptidase [Roseateles asaccharophilus]MDN3546081.1 M3 family metallopeptidase [Roseateles asaccharophilus]TDP11190.1 oligopeptidase A [Roseateles asaccharophilus]
MNTNPLLSTAPLPAFASIQPEHIQPAISQLLDEAKAALAQATDAATPADYDTLARVLSVATERLSHAWGAVGHLNAVANTPALREAYNAMLPAVTEFYTALGADEQLYAKYKAIQAQAATLSPARQQALKHWIRDFVLSGAELQGAARDRFAAIQEEAAELGQKFSEHVMDATDGFAHYASAEELAGVPADVVANARAAAEAEGKAGHKLTLHFPSYFPVMQYAENRALRETLYRAYVTRASELGAQPELDNSALMQQLLMLRQEEAQLLGFKNFAEVSLVPKMAQSPEQVLDFLRDLAGRARPYAEKDLAEMREFAAAKLGLAEMQAWDQAYVAEKLKEARYAFSDQEVREYLTVPRVLSGLFDIIQRLFDVKIIESQAEVWHESVKFYRLERAGQLIGQFYLDLYARPGKRPGAWMDEVRSRWARPEGQLQTPVAQLVCNFASPAGDKPALLTHDDVTTLFHEFGHGLHHLLTQVDELGVSGISGVEWDAVELPSQFMENFCWEWEVLQQLSSHVQTGEPLPRALYDKMIAAKNFQSGLQTLRQIEFALFDMRLHAEPGQEQSVQQLLDEVRAEVSVNPPPAFNRFQHSFSHIFAGGYSAGYYSYKWAEVLSADAWSAFEEEGVFNPATGRRYLQSILEAGGARDALDNFKAFRGREPRIDALLRHQGMA